MIYQNGCCGVRSSKSKTGGSAQGERGVPWPCRVVVCVNRPWNIGPPELSPPISAPAQEQYFSQTIPSVLYGWAFKQNQRYFVKHWLLRALSSLDWRAKNFNSMSQLHMCLLEVVWTRLWPSSPSCNREDHSNNAQTWQPLPRNYRHMPALSCSAEGWRGLCEVSRIPSHALSPSPSQVTHIWEESGRR